MGKNSTGQGRRVKHPVLNTGTTQKHRNRAQDFCVARGAFNPPTTEAPSNSRGRGVIIVSLHLVTIGVRIISLLLLLFSHTIHQDLLSRNSYSACGSKQFPNQRKYEEVRSECKTHLLRVKSQRPTMCYQETLTQLAAQNSFQIKENTKKSGASVKHICSV
ncbi:hypothetical protein CDAR_547311 [Caerostris darwini]|uniref:Uncharacterized protein n=1 Tax=Caerostris darwini TaxID=1538125 RepID=A0AAV4VVH9_9ARAC|nr:hypothetical protein CDAR_547311 [Caerostris darwini]